jgi:hypothetical protein
VSNEKLIRMKFKFVQALVLLGFSLAILPVHANFYCAGKMTWLGINEAGVLYVATDAVAIHGVCNIEKSDGFAMSSAACRVAYTSMLAAKLSEKRIVTYYLADGKSCADIAAWTVVKDMYFVQGPE